MDIIYWLVAVISATTFTTLAVGDNKHSSITRTTQQKLMGYFNHQSKQPILRSVVLTTKVSQTYNIGYYMLSVDLTIVC